MSGINGQFFYRSEKRSLDHTDTAVKVVQLVEELRVKQHDLGGKEFKSTAIENGNGNFFKVGIAYIKDAVIDLGIKVNLMHSLSLILFR